MTLQTTSPTDAHSTLSLVTGIQIRNWGSELVLRCLDDPSTRRTYELLFTRCREIRWSVDDAAVALEDEVEADVIGFCVGREGYAEPAVLTTDLFEVSILYDRIEIREFTGAGG